MQNKKITFVIIIILLLIFVPLAIMATTLHLQNKNQTIENPNHEFLYNGKLYFYENEELLGTYTCEKEDYCDYAVSRNNSTFPLLEYKEDKREKMSLIQNRYAFLMDTTITSLNDAEVILYDLETNQETGRYAEVKNYGIGIENNIYLVKNKEGLWGAIQFEDGVVNLLIPYNYDYIGLIDQKDANTEKILANLFAVQKDNVWYLIDNNNNKVTDSFTDAIVSYSNEYVIVSNGTSMQLLNYTGRNRLFGDYKYINFCGKYIAIVDNSDVFYLFDLESNSEVGNRHNVKNPSDLSFEVVNNYARVSLAGELIENIAIR